MHCSITCFCKSPPRMDWQQFCPKKPMSVPGFEPGLLGQNAVALPLAPTPPPPRTLFFEFCIYFGSGAPPVGTSSFAKRLGHQRNGSFKVFRWRQSSSNGLSRIDQTKEKVAPVFNYFFPSSHLYLPATDDTAKIYFLPPYPGLVIQTHVSRVAPRPGTLWRTLYRLSYSAAAGFLRWWWLGG